MKSWQYARGITLAVLVAILLIACRSGVDSSQPDGGSDVVPPAEQTDDPSEEVTDVPESLFDPDDTRDGMVMVYVPEGEFEMGTTDDRMQELIDQNLWDDGWNDAEQPAHMVYLDAYWFDKTEVTNGQYALCVADGACEAPAMARSLTRESYYGDPEYEDYPVLYVDWHMAEAYCAWAGRRLPTEAEWEKAARGTDGRFYPWGDEIDSTRANYDGAGCRECDTTPVGSYPEGTSFYGALDMAGNVYEWVADEWDKHYYRDSSSDNPLGPSFGLDKRPMRGGSWNGDANSVRSAARYGYRRGWADFPSAGIRCAASP